MVVVRLILRFPFGSPDHRSGSNRSYACVRGPVKLSINGGGYSGCRSFPLPRKHVPATAVSKYVVYCRKKRMAGGKCYSNDRTEFQNYYNFTTLRNLLNMNNGLVVEFYWTRTVIVSRTRESDYPSSPIVVYIVTGFAGNWNPTVRFVFCHSLRFYCSSNDFDRAFF